jgi:hypothetical protein
MVQDSVPAKSLAVSKTLIAAFLLFAANRVPFVQEIVGQNPAEVVDLIVGLFSALRLITKTPVAVKLPGK